MVIDGVVPLGPETLYRTLAPGARNKEAAVGVGLVAGAASQPLAPDSWLGRWVNEKEIQVFPHYVQRAPRALCPGLPG